jgi:hypothetical protein
MAKLNSYVHVPVDNDWVVYGPDDEVPAEHAALITNPKAWEGGEAPSTKSEEPSSAQGDEEPPRSGKGSSKEAWAEFAQTHGVQVEDGDSRDDIIAALVEAGVVEE